MTRIGFLGAFSIDNAGDALVGLAVRQAVAELCPAATQQVFAPAFPEALWHHDFGPDRGLGVPITPISGDPAAPVEEAMAWARGLDALIIGGGGILSPDPTFRAFLLGQPERFMDPAHGPAVPAAWCAVCSQSQAAYLSDYAEGYARIRRCAEMLRYVSVRNRSTLSFLRICGYDGPVHVVPDPAIALTVPPDRLAALDAEVDDALAAAGVPPRDLGRRLVGVSVGRAVTDPRAAAFFADLFATLAGAQPRMTAAPPTVTDAPGDPATAALLPMQVVLFPFGALYGDAAFQEQAAAALPEARVLRRPLSPLALFRLIGRLDLYVCTRLHAMLSAYAQDVPFLVLDEYLSDDVATSKIREFIVDRGLLPFYLCPFLGTSPGWKLRALLNNLPAISFQVGIGRDRQALRQHTAAMCAALGLLAPAGAGAVIS